MPNTYSEPLDVLLQRALERGLIDYYERRGNCIYLEAASLQVELTEVQARRWIETVLENFRRIQGNDTD